VAGQTKHGPKSAENPGDYFGCSSYLRWWNVWGISSQQNSKTEVAQQESIRANRTGQDRWWMESEDCHWQWSEPSSHSYHTPQANSGGRHPRGIDRVEEL